MKIVTKNSNLIKNSNFLLSKLIYHFIFQKIHFAPKKSRTFNTDCGKFIGKNIKLFQSGKNFRHRTNLLNNKLIKKIVSLIVWSLGVRLIANSKTIFSS
jgi:hypothetical protein